MLKELGIGCAGLCVQPVRIVQESFSSRGSAQKLIAGQLFNSYSCFLLSSPNKHCLAGWAACNPYSTFRAVSNPFQQAAAFPVFPPSQSQHTRPKQPLPVAASSLVVQCCCKPSLSGAAMLTHSSEGVTSMPWYGYHGNARY